MDAADSRRNAFLSLLIDCIALFTAIAVLLYVIANIRAPVRTSSKDAQQSTASLDYEDEDGIATCEVSKRRKAPRSAIISPIFVILGLAATVLDIVYQLRNTRKSKQDLAASGILIAAWSANLLSVTLLNFVPRHRLRFNCGQSCACGLLAVCLSSISHTSVTYDNRRIHVPNGGDGILWSGLLQVAASLAACIISLSIARRPHIEYAGRPVDQYGTVCALRKWSFDWATHLFALARSNGHLELVDLPTLRRDARSEFRLAGSPIEVRQSSLWKALIKEFWQPLLYQSVCTALQSVVQFAPSIILFALLRVLESQSTEGGLPAYVWILILGLGVSSIFAAWLNVWLQWSAFAKVALPIRLKLSAVIYAKAAKRKNSEQSRSEPRADCKDGDVGTDGLKNSSHQLQCDEGCAGLQRNAVNLLGFDVTRVFQFLQSHFMFVQTAVSLSISIGFLWSLLGWQALSAGILVFLLVLPINTVASKQSAKVQSQLLDVRDEKSTLLSEVLQGVRQIKFSAYEEQWQARIGALRQTELHIQWRLFCYETVLIFCYNLGPIALSAVALAVYAIIYGALSASVAFTAIMVFSVLESSLAVLPQYTAMGIQAWVSLQRIRDYLRLPEKEDYVVAGVQIEYEKATIAWSRDDSDSRSSRFVLRDLNFQLPNKEITIICGPTGSGKSLLLASLIGEADVIHGRILAPRPPLLADRHDRTACQGNWIIDSAIAFAAQTPWIENGTIRDNILFGLPHRQERYEKVISHCALEQDIASLPDGDMTEVGFNGVNLSGGQKWRISFARVLYSRAGILVIDDLFSAVDVHVAQHLLDKALLGELGAGRTRILATHHVNLCMSNATKIITLEKGRLHYQGSPQNLREEQLGEFLIPNLGSSPSDSPYKLDPERHGPQLAAFNGSSSTGTDGIKPDSKAPPNKFVQEEFKERGATKLSTYWNYVQGSGGLISWLPILALFAGHQLLLLGRSWSVGILTRSSKSCTISLRTLLHSEPSGTHILQGNETCSLPHIWDIYLGLSAVLCVTAGLRYFFVYGRSIQASRGLFKSMAAAILQAPLRWLDTVPVGRIMNRFTSDFESIDSSVGTQIGALIYGIMQILGIIAGAMVVSPWMLVIAAVLCLFSTWTALWYITGAREMKRLESIARSPVFELLGSTLTGLTTIRAFGNTSTYLHQMLERIDVHSRSLWYISFGNGWVTLRLNAIGAVFTMVVAATVFSSGIDASLAGFALSFALQYSATICLVTNLGSNVDLAMNSVERVSEYANIAVEDQNHATSSVPASWPLHGQIDVSELVVAYAPHLPAVIEGLTFSVAPNERVGIIGRTGAGKSSLTLALFRFLEAQAGSILIDGLDIAHVALPTLRSRMTIIPQDPVLFSGTVRSNLDIFGTHDDTELWDALRRAQLRSAGDQDLSLEMEVAASGLNLSQGQKQLLCLARAIVARPKILVLDEATSAIDLTTDQLIQKTIRREFTGTTLLVIAHRLSTIADFDKILVMEDGRAVEFGRPRDLLFKQTGRTVFKDMVESSSEQEELRRTILGSDD